MMLSEDRMMRILEYWLGVLGPLTQRCGWDEVNQVTNQALSGSRRLGVKSHDLSHLIHRSMD